MNWRQKLCLSLILLPLSSHTVWANSRDHAASVLFSSFDTVFGSDSSLLLRRPIDSASSFAWHPFDYMRAGLDVLGKQMSDQVLSNSTAILVGLKDFAPPNGLGSVQARRCYIVVLQDSSKLDFGKTLKDLQTVSFSGSVWNWSAGIGEFGDAAPRSSSLYATLVAHSYLLISNNREDLILVSKQLLSVTDDAQVLAGIHEWNKLGRHNFWGYRSYRRTESAGTTARFIGLDSVTPQAQAILVFLESTKPEGRLRLFSSTSADTTAESLNSTNRIAPLSPSGPNIWQAEFPLDEVGPFPESANWVWWLFGLGVLV